MGILGYMTFISGGIRDDGTLARNAINAIDWSSGNLGVIITLIVDAGTRLTPDSGALRSLRKLIEATTEKWDELEVTENRVVAANLFAVLDGEISAGNLTEICLRRRAKSDLSIQGRSDTAVSITRGMVSSEQKAELAEKYEAAISTIGLVELRLMSE